MTNGCNDVEAGWSVYFTPSSTTTHTVFAFVSFYRWDEKLTPENASFLKEIVDETYANKTSPLKEGPWKRGDFTATPETIRTGVLGLKLGTLPQWDKKGKKFYVTLVQVSASLRTSDAFTARRCLDRR